MVGLKEEYKLSILQSIGVFGIIIIAMLVFSPILFLRGIIGEEITSLIYYIFTMGVPFFVIFDIIKKKGIYEKTLFDFRVDNYKVLSLTAITIITIQIGFTIPIISLLPMPEYIQKIFMEFAGKNDFFSFLTIVIAAPILEELIFRGIILGGLLKKYSPLTAIIVSSVLFGLIHLNPWQFISAMIIGAFSGWIYYKTRKLSYSIFIHLTNNAVAFLNMILTDPVESINKPLTETYGGNTTVFMIVTLSSIIIAIVGVLILKKEFKKESATHNMQYISQPITSSLTSDSEEKKISTFVSGDRE